MEEKIERVNQQIEGVEAKIEQVEQAIANAEAEWRKGGPHEGIWLKREEDLRKEKGRLQYKENQLRELLLRITPPAGLQLSAISETSSGAQVQGLQAGATPPVIQLQLPEDIAAIVRRVAKKEFNVDFPDEISIGGSKSDLEDAMEALGRMGFQGLETIIGDLDPALDADNSGVFNWKAGVREDDSANMTAAQSFVQENISAHLEGYKAVNVCQLNIFSKVDATPTKRLKLRETKTDLALVMDEFEAQAKENPRNVLDKTSGIVDTKTEAAWKKNHKEFRGQALGQFVGCTLVSRRKGVGMPVMLTNLIGDSNVFHGAQDSDGRAVVREVQFTNQSAAFRYFAGVCKKAEVASRRKVDDLLKDLDNLQPHHPVAPLESPARNPLLGTSSNISPPHPSNDDLTECIYKETQREQPLFNLPQFELMMRYWGNLEEGLLRAPELQSFPSYMS
ncbi:hypothetical protein KFL_008160050 [Klebsormidium nitens]|uniref:Uncharacterized protein n=1 Tax=Klebsormidium nitens TaxID=105231 RepID=A0A1Y1IL44_KLENI|nr:hypothetical protein KFL_008160050 [Klebsormidium nitens]|eukprot:GAQ91605.1 hypothetical protein KFL_008160050 [Klebsormidium nitens]